MTSPARPPDRGVSYAPVALLLPFNQGLPQWGGNPWSYFPAERPDMMIDAFMYTVVPFAQDVRKGQEGCLANGELAISTTCSCPIRPVGRFLWLGCWTIKWRSCWAA